MVSCTGSLTCCTHYQILIQSIRLLNILTLLDPYLEIFNDLSVSVLIRKELVFKPLNLKNFKLDKHQSLTCMFLRHHYHIFSTCSHEWYLEKLQEVFIKAYGEVNMATHVRVMQKYIDMDKPMFSSENKDNSDIFLILFLQLSIKNRETVKDKLLIPEKKISKPKFPFIHLQSVFKASLLISLSYYHVSSTFLILFPNEPFWIRGKQTTFAVNGYERRAQTSNMRLFLMNQMSGNPGLIWQDFLHRVAQQISIQSTAESPSSLEPEMTMIMLVGQSSRKMCQVFMCPSGLILLSAATFKASGFSQRGECVLKKNNTKNIIPSSEQLWAGKHSRRANSLCE